MSLSVVSLFSGCGGLDSGFRQPEFDLLYACDSDPAAVDCYRRNLGDHVRLVDVTSDAFHGDISAIGHCDVLLGGFPCQGFSKAGPKKSNDPRNLLYEEMLRAVERLRPSLFVAENVDGISQNFNGSFLKRISAEFAQLGYRLDHRVLDAVGFGVPQHRRRVFFIGVRDDLNLQFTWPSATHAVKNRNGDFRVQFFSLFDGQFPHDGLLPVMTIGQAIGDLRELRNDIPDHFVSRNWPIRYEHVFAAIKEGQKLCNVRHSPTSVYTWAIPEVFGAVTERERTILGTIAKHRRHKKYGDIPNGNPIPIEELERLAGIDGIAPEISSLLEKGYTKRVNEGFDLKGAMFCSGIFKRPNWNQPSPTVLTNFYNPRYFLHPLEDRPFSLRECARLQGFRDDFKIMSNTVDLVGGYRLIGNAVAPPVSEHIAASILTCLTTRSRVMVSTL